MRTRYRTLLIGLLAPLAACSGQTVGDIGGQTITLDPADALRVETDDGRIEVLVGEGDGFTVEVLPGSGADSHTERMDGDTRILEAVCGSGEVGCGVGFILEVPADQALDLQTGAGPIDLGAGLTGDVAAQTATSDITGTDLGAMDLSVLTGSGLQQVGFSDVPRAVDLDGGSGSIVLTLPAGGYALDIDTNGSVSTEGVDDDTSGPSVRCQSGTGDITITGI